MNIYPVAAAPNRGAAIALVKNTKQNTPTVLIDDREKLPLVFHRLPSKKTRLRVGDYSLLGVENFIIERKRYDDFVRSISGTRRAPFFDNLKRMRDGYSFARLIIIGSPAFKLKVHAMAKLRNKGRIHISQTCIDGTLEAIQKHFFPVVQVDTAEQAATMIEQWALDFHSHHE